MNGIHDMGGMDGLGPVVHENDEPVFHFDWERRMFALALVCRTSANTDEFRHAIERIPAPRYLGSSYYERWLDAVMILLMEKGLLSREELAARGAEPPVAAQPPDFSNGPRSKVSRARARFSVGERVLARNLHPPGHTRLPRYVRGKHGMIWRDWGVYAFPDTSAHGGGERRQHVYSVAFKARELWGAQAPSRDTVYIDLWEDYLAGDEQGSKRTLRRKKVRPRGGVRGSDERKSHAGAQRRRA